MPGDVLQAWPALRNHFCIHFFVTWHKTQPIRLFLMNFAVNIFTSIEFIANAENVKFRNMQLALVGTVPVLMSNSRVTGGWESFRSCF